MCSARIKNDTLNTQGLDTCVLSLANLVCYMCYSLFDLDSTSRTFISIIRKSFFAIAAVVLAMVTPRLGNRFCFVKLKSTSFVDVPRCTQKFALGALVREPRHPNQFGECWTFSKGDEEDDIFHHQRILLMQRCSVIIHVPTEITRKYLVVYPNFSEYSYSKISIA